MRLRSLIIGAAMFSSFNFVQATIKLPAFFGSNMVLQQRENIKIWGKGTPGKKVRIKNTWDRTTRQTVADKDGNWSLFLSTPQAGGPYSLEISDGQSVFLEDIMIGEVWFCSGQSNMEMPVKGFRGQPVESAQETIISANERAPLRLFNVKRAYATTPKEDVEGDWQKCTPGNVASFSATAYFFGNLLQKALNVPVGLIHSSWSASKIEAWMSKESLERFPEIKIDFDTDTEIKQPNITPTLLYNGMVKPFDGFKVKGIIWYQGESNSSNPDLYSRLFSVWVEQNRSFFQSDSLPVYFTEIAPYQSNDKNGINLPLFRASQLKSMREIPFTGMAFTQDVGSELFIHSPYKRQVGERLAYWALAKTYGKEGFGYAGPVLGGYQLKEDKIELKFDFAENGLNPENAEIIGFEIAGDDGIFYPANARIINGSSRVSIWNDSIQSPRQLRYAFRNYTVSNLTNGYGLPAAGFQINFD
ncbi:MAG: sialate O-acetylesterase [Bacteroidales bacterium]